MIKKVLAVGIVTILIMITCFMPILTRDVQQATTGPPTIATLFSYSYLSDAGAIFQSVPTAAVTIMNQQAIQEAETALDNSMLQLVLMLTAMIIIMLMVSVSIGSVRGRARYYMKRLSLSQSNANLTG